MTFYVLIVFKNNVAKLTYHRELFEKQRNHRIRIHHFDFQLSNFGHSNYYQPFPFQLAERNQHRNGLQT